MSNGSNPTPESVDPDEIVRLTFYMKAHRRWSSKREPPSGSPGPGPACLGADPLRPAVQPLPWAQERLGAPEWGALDQPAADWLVADLTERQRAAMRRMVAAGGDGVWTNELRDLAGYEPEERMNGVFRALAGRCKSCGRRPFWNGGAKDPAKGQKLTLTAGVTLELFAEAIRRNTD